MMDFCNENSEVAKIKRYNFIAIDLGATSGRCMLCLLSEDSMEMKELIRFPNQILRIGKHYFWNIFSIYEAILEGLKAAAVENVRIDAIGIDTWGVDFVCIGKDGSLLGLPYSYRDPHTGNVQTQFFKEVMSRSDLYMATGIQLLDFNTLFQLYAMKKDASSCLAAADRILFMPDAFSYLLTGKYITEYTIASTSQFVNPFTKQIDKNILKSAGLNPNLFEHIVMPGTIVGVLRNNIAEDCGLKPGIPVVAVAGHDTGSAVVAVPAIGENFAYLSSGTWSLMGVERMTPEINEDTYRANMTNEGGAEGTVRLLKNITGMWILENCMSEWKAAGYNYTYGEIVEMAGPKPLFKSFIDPDDASFVHPESMAVAIKKYCIDTGQSVPESHRELVSCIFESLAMKYRKVFLEFQKLSDNRIQKLYVIGGGSKNALLNQYIADSIGIEVIAGPSEAAAIGNVMLQAKSVGIFNSLTGIRAFIRKNIELKSYFPKDTILWKRIFDHYIKIINKI